MQIQFSQIIEQVRNEMKQLKRSNDPPEPFSYPLRENNPRLEVSIIEGLEVLCKEKETQVQVDLSNPVIQVREQNVQVNPIIHTYPQIYSEPTTVINNLPQFSPNIIIPELKLPTINNYVNVQTPQPITVVTQPATVINKIDPITITTQPPTIINNIEPIIITSKVQQPTIVNNVKIQSQKQITQILNHLIQKASRKPFLSIKKTIDIKITSALKHKKKLKNGFCQVNLDITNKKSQKRIKINVNPEIKLNPNQILLQPKIRNIMTFQPMIKNYSTIEPMIKTYATLNPKIPNPIRINKIVKISKIKHNQKYQIPNKQMKKKKIKCMRKIVKYKKKYVEKKATFPSTEQQTTTKHEQKEHVKLSKFERQNLIQKLKQKTKRLKYGEIDQAAIKEVINSIHRGEINRDQAYEIMNCFQYLQNSFDRDDLEIDEQF